MIVSWTFVDMCIQSFDHLIFDHLIIRSFDYVIVDHSIIVHLII